MTRKGMCVEGSFSFRKVGDFARLDEARAARTGVPEIILAEGKTPAQVARIAEAARGTVIVSRFSPAHLREVRKAFPKAEARMDARIIVVRKGKRPFLRDGCAIGVLTAGTSDIPVAEEAAVVAEEMGCKVLRAFDVGVAGIHRLFPALRGMRGAGARALVVAAGREGTLPAIVAGLVDVPVIGLPTSTGYGFGGKGEAALKSMLQSCSFLTVVNIDNGVAAGACAALIAKGVER
ncbi:MAG: nickel pincer cofactor biosynthesis protein LarB [Candidatus ainarchaeum sp.]|nr:nickel pincer cofactor biosynthesis protein LarB [Candidatus ainarchaeum sp.]